jgi:hypothetical protein
VDSVRAHRVWGVCARRLARLESERFEATQIQMKLSRAEARAAAAEREVRVLLSCHDFAVFSSCIFFWGIA